MHVHAHISLCESGMMYPLKYCLLIQVLLVFMCEVQTSKAAENQRNLLRDYFQKALINDSKNLLTLQQVFLTPRPKFQNGLYLYINVVVEGRVTHSFTDSKHCRYLSQNNSCICQISMKFELVPPDQDGSVSIIQKFLNSYHISIVLEVLDPSFYSMVACVHQYMYTGLTYRSDYDEEDYLYHLEINFKVDKFKIMVQTTDLPKDVHNALYLTLSWVSLII